MKHRIILLICFWTSPLFAQQAQVQATVQATEQAATPVPRYDFNAILQYQPQFLFEALRNGEVIHIKNSGIGDGIAGTTGSPPTLDGAAVSQGSFFCSSDDEENSYLKLNGGNPLNLLGVEGSYHLFRIKDQWRSRRDNLGLYLATPLLAVNCTRSGNKSAALNFPQWRNINTTTVNAETPALRSMVRNHFQRRNFSEDSSNFRYGRYLFKFMDKDNYDLLSFGVVADSDPAALNHFYKPFYFQPDYLDCPYGREHQKWGILCPELSRVGAYSSLSFPDMSHLGLLVGGVIDAERWNFWKDLLTQSLHLIGYRIDHEYWGRLRSRASSGQSTAGWENNEREMAGIIVTLWEILKNGIDRMPSAPFGSAWSSAWRRAAERMRGIRNIQGECGNVPNGLLLYVDRSGSSPKFVFRKDICRDVLSKKTLSHPHFNVGPFPDVSGTSINASYGVIQEGGTYENLFTPNRGYQWILNNSADEMLAEARDGKVAARGYGGLIASLMAHQLCHLHYRETAGEMQWGTPQASAEEELCMMTQALVFQTLSELGHIRGGGISTEEYNPDSNPNVVNPVEDGFVGKRFFYKDEPRALNSIVVAPLHEDMAVIAHNLKRRDHEMARMGAHLVSMCPFFEEPRWASLNGDVGSNPYYVAPPPPPTPAPQQATTVPAQSGGSTPQQQIQQGVQTLGNRPLPGQSGMTLEQIRQKGAPKNGVPPTGQKMERNKQAPAPAGKNTGTGK